MKVEWLYPGFALRAKSGYYIGPHGDRDRWRQGASKFIMIVRDMGWWDDFADGESEVMIYVGHRRSSTGKLYREVLWRGDVYSVRPHDWRYIEHLTESGDAPLISQA